MKNIVVRDFSLEIVNKAVDYNAKKEEEHVRKIKKDGLPKVTGTMNSKANRAARTLRNLDGLTLYYLLWEIEELKRVNLSAASAILLADSIMGCKESEAVTAQIDTCGNDIAEKDCIFEIHNRDEDDELFLKKEVPSYRDLEYKNKRKRKW